MRVVCLSALFVAMPGCLQPTQITVELTTDVDCSTIDTTRIFVGTESEVDTRPPSAEGPPPTCKDGRLGKIVLVPSGNADRLVVRALTALRGSKCATDLTSGCIQAKRSISFIPHTPLLVPILMSATCKNVICPVDQTCKQGRCVPSEVDPRGCVGATGCDESQLDGGAIEAGTDAGPPVLCMSVAIPNAPLPILGWHFDEVASPIAPFLGTMSNVALPMGVTLVSGGTCGRALSLNGTSLQLGTASVMTPVTMTMWFQSTTPNGTIVSHRVPNGAGWQVTLTNNLITVGSCPSTGQCLSQSATLVPGQHVIWGSFSAASSKLFVDGMPYVSGGGTAVPATTAPLIVGPFTGVIDEVYVYGFAQ